MINLIYACFKYGAKKEGQEVDFTADDIGDWLNDDVDKIGAGMKRQDGKPITKEQIEEIKSGVIDFADTLGLDMKKLAQDDRWVYVHLNNKNPFLMKNTAGLYRKGDGNISISVGGREVIKRIVDGKEVKEFINPTIAHELGHAIDHKIKNKLFEFPFIYKRKFDFNVGADSYKMKYFREDVEITARMIEEYVAVKKGSDKFYDRYGYWNKEIFENEIIPAIEKSLNKNFADYRLLKTDIAKTGTELKVETGEQASFVFKTGKNDFFDSGRISEEAAIKAEQKMQEAQVTYETLLMKTEGFNENQLSLFNKIKQTINVNKKFKEGDIETVRKSNMGKDLDKAVEAIREKYPSATDEEALEMIMDMPSKIAIREAEMASLGKEPQDLGEMVRMREGTLAKKKLKAIEQGIKKGRVMSKVDIKETQNEVLKLIKESNLDRKSVV
jgi:hypothetical protein